MNSQAKAKSERRRGITRYVVPHPSYGWFVKSMASGAAISGLVLASILKFYETRVFERLEASGILQPEHRSVVEAYAADVFSMSLVLGATFIVFVVLMASFFFHGVAGPMYRMSTYLREVLSKGRRYKLTLRDGDQFKDLAELINRVLDAEEKKRKEKPGEELGVTGPILAGKNKANTNTAAAETTSETVNRSLAEA